MELSILSEQELVASVKSGIKPCYFLFGKDVATLESFVKKLTGKIVPSEARDLNYRFFPGGEPDIPAIADSVEALPVFAERTLTAVNDLDCDKLTPKQITELKEIVSLVDPETSTLLFYSTAADLTGGKKNLTEKNKSFAEHIVKCGGAVAEFKIKKPEELIRFICKSVEKEGSAISEQAARMLAERCGSDLMMIKNEIAKLSAYRCGSEISPDDISALVTGQIDADAYKLARQISEGRREQAFETLDRLYSLQKETPALLTAVAYSFMDLYRAKLAMMSGRGLKEMTSSFQYKGREFAAKNALRDCSRIPIEKLRMCISVLSECDAGIKSLRTDDRVLFEEAIVRMLS